VALCDGAVEIAMDGIKNSLNVAVAFGIIGYHIRSCMVPK
jgi:tRNA G18 (ribose-2'-O)-methylase SpoU